LPLLFINEASKVIDVYLSWLRSTNQVPYYITSLKTLLVACYQSDKPTAIAYHSRPL
jgi:hypothetical protein